MRNVLITLFYVMLCPCSGDHVGVATNPLLGSQQRWPGNTGYNLSWEGGSFLYHGDKDLTRLLDVGARQSDNPSISYVPPLDGASPSDTLRQDHYAMKLVLFDLQLVQLKSVDPVGGSFRVELQMILHWVDSVIEGSNGISQLNECSFLCDTTSPRTTCCDKVWVPPLRLSGCDINNIESSTPLPYIIHYSPPDVIGYDACLKPENSGKCIWRRLWYLNIDTTCKSQMDFHNFPFDLQDLTIDILNPYSSRTWFQFTKGFLKRNIGEDINGVNLSPDSKIPGWYVKDLTVSSTCGTSQTWLQTFLAQDKLLSALSKTYDSQRTHIVDALNSKNLTCSMMQDLNMSEDENLVISTNTKPYLIALENYRERVSFALHNYRQCIEVNGKNFSWNTTFINTTEFRDFSTSTDNIIRSFSLLDLKKDLQINKVWFPCAITAIANLTIPGIRVTIRVKRYRMFYVVKLILPTLACVAFTFSAFGLEPKDLMGRLTVVVPSAIALTALQGLVVSTDIPPVAYIAPSTYIILISYIAQVLIAFESILVHWLLTRKRPKFLQMGCIRKERAQLSKNNAHRTHVTTNDAEQLGPKSATRKFDLLCMCFLGLLYVMAIMVCTLLPWNSSEKKEREVLPGFISIWN